MGQRRAQQFNISKGQMQQSGEPFWPVVDKRRLEGLRWGGQDACSPPLTACAKSTPASFATSRNRSQSTATW
jgi:hypothetical protein